MRKRGLTGIAAVTVVGLLALGSVGDLGHPAVQAQHVVASDHAGFFFQQITVSTVAVGLTAASVSPTTAPGAKSVYCTVESQPIRYRYDGTNPSSTVGHLVAAGGSLTLNGINNVLRLRMIRQGASDATVFCTAAR